MISARAGRGLFLFRSGFPLYLAHIAPEDRTVIPSDRNWVANGGPTGAYRTAVSDLLLLGNTLHSEDPQFAVLIANLASRYAGEV